MMNIKEMAMNNGKTTYNGVEYVLLQQAYTNDGETYEATAIRPDELDKAEDGWVTAYEIVWNVLDSYNPDEQEEDCACDWRNADEVNECGEYNIEDDRIC